MKHIGTISSMDGKEVNYGNVRLWIVEFPGFGSEIIRRIFDTQERAAQWIAQCGKSNVARIHDAVYLGDMK